METKQEAPKSDFKKRILELSSQNQKLTKRAILKQIFSRSEKQSFRVRTYRNLVVLAISSLLYSSSQGGISSLQTSLNSSNLLGLLVHLMSSFTTVLFCLYLPIVSLQLFGFKWSFIIAQSVASTYIIANEFPMPQILIPSGVLHAIGGVVLGPLHIAFIALLAKQYTEYTKGNPVFILVKFFAINSSITHFSSILGNLISAVILNENIFTGRHESHSSNSTNSSGKYSSRTSSPSMYRATTIKNQVVNATKICGSSSCPYNYSPVEQPPKTEVFFFL